MPIRRLSLAPRSRVGAEMVTRATPLWRPCFSHARRSSPVGADQRRLYRCVLPDARTILSCTRMGDGQRSALKWLIVESAYGLLRLPRVVKFDKSKPARPPAFPLRREMNVRQWADGREMLPQLGFGGMIGQIPNKQSNRYGTSPLDPLLILCKGVSDGGQLTQWLYEAIPRTHAAIRLPTPLVSCLARAGRDTAAARAAGGPIALRLGQFNEACFVLRLGQPINPGRAAPRPHPCDLHIIPPGGAETARTVPVNS